MRFAFMGHHRRSRRRSGLLELSIGQILAWADSHYERTGSWPQCRTGRIFGGQGETWRNVDNALRYGFAGLPGGSSLARLLAEQRGVRNPRRPPTLTIEQILAWADAHFKHHKSWP